MSDASTPDAVGFGGLLPKPVVARFDQPDSSSDAGAVLLRALDERLGLTRAMAGALIDRRSADRVRHSLHDVLRQRICGVACGYEDTNDSARLRHDPAQKLLLGRDPLAGVALASQPTLSRFENGVSARAPHQDRRLVRTHPPPPPPAPPPRGTLAAREERAKPQRRN